MPNEHRRTECTARITGHWLNPDYESNGPSRLNRPLATQFSATPPARTRFFQLESPSWSDRAIRMITSSVTDWMLDAKSMCRGSRGESGFRGGPPKRSSNRAVHHRQTLAVVEIFHVEPQTAVRSEIDEMSVDDVAIGGLPVRGQPH